MEIKAAFGKTMRRLRQQKNLSQEEMAALSDLHRTYISDVELGRRNISLENIDAITRALGITKSVFFMEMEKDESI